MIELGDDELTAKFIDRPEQTFRVVYERYSGMLLRFIYRFTGNREAAEEILHDIFAQLLDGKFKPQMDGTLKGWLFTVARNKSLNVLKSQARPVHILEPEAETGPEARLIEYAQMKRLHAAEAALPEDLKQTWSLRKQGLDYREIAERLALPLGTVKSRFSRLVEFLKEELANEP